MAAALFLLVTGGTFITVAVDIVDLPGSDLWYALAASLFISAAPALPLLPSTRADLEPAPPPVDESAWQPDPEWQPQRRGSGALAKTIAGLAVLVAIVGGAWIAVEFLAKERPAGVTDAELLAVVEEQIDSCADSALFAPTDCPQQFHGGSGSASWRLFGDPMAGAVVDWNSFRGVFEITGNAVMRIDYNAGSSRSVEVVPFSYRATVNWRSGSATFDGFARSSDDGEPAEIVKPRSHLPESAFRSAVAKAFRRCVSVETRTMPPGCPDGSGSPLMTEFRWGLANNPLQHATVSYDDAFGLVKVRGDSAIWVAHPEANNTGEELQGPYEATLVDAGGKAKVLDIERVS